MRSGEGRGGAVAHQAAVGGGCTGSIWRSRGRGNLWGTCGNVSQQTEGTHCQCFPTKGCPFAA